VKQLAGLSLTRFPLRTLYSGVIDFIIHLPLT
jgi:hypothetical protein